MSELLNQIEDYWTHRAKSYSDVVNHELNHENEKNWLDVIVSHLPKKDNIKILDLGTGPGFFAIGLSKRGYQVTGVDYTSEMLNQAFKNAGVWNHNIQWIQGDVHHLPFENESYDVIVTRNLTWNLQYPDLAYQEMYRVLKKDGVMMNFDAAWYRYLFDEEKQKAFQEDRQRVQEENVFDFDSYNQGHIMEDISRQLVLSRCMRPQEDIRLLIEAGFSSLYVNQKIWQDVWDDVEKVNYASTPLFMIKATK